MLNISSAARLFISNALNFCLAGFFSLSSLHPLCFNSFLLFEFCLFSGFISQTGGAFLSFTRLTFCTFYRCACFGFPAGCRVQICLMLGFRITFGLLSCFTLQSFVTFTLRLLSQKTLFFTLAVKFLVQQQGYFVIRFDLFSENLCRDTCFFFLFEALLLGFPLSQGAANFIAKVVAFIGEAAQFSLNNLWLLFQALQIIAAWLFNSGFAAGYLGGQRSDAGAALCSAQIRNFVYFGADLFQKRIQAVLYENCRRHIWRDFDNC